MIQYFQQPRTWSLSSDASMWVPVCVCHFSWSDSRYICGIQFSHSEQFSWKMSGLCSRPESLLSETPHVKKPVLHTLFYSTALMQKVGAERRWWAADRFCERKKKKKNWIEFEHQPTYQTGKLDPVKNVFCQLRGFSTNSCFLAETLGVLSRSCWDNYRRAERQTGRRWGIDDEVEEGNKQLSTMEGGDGRTGWEEEACIISPSQRKYGTMAPTIANVSSG